jgi:hypothetical protein
VKPDGQKKEMVIKMATDRDQEFIRFLLAQTLEGKIQWEPTASDDQFTASFKGKYKIFVDKFIPDDSHPYYVMKLTDAKDQELLSMSDSDMPGIEVRKLFENARRRSLNVDTAIDEIMGESAGDVTDEDIPF